MTRGKYYFNLCIYSINTVIPPPCLLRFLDLGYGRPGEVPVLRRSILPWRRLLRPGVRRHGAQHLQDSGQLEG